jgi:hypothetical protein
LRWTSILTLFLINWKRRVSFFVLLFSWNIFFWILVNQSDTEEKETNEIVNTSSPLSPPSLPLTSRISVDELLLLDLDPYANTENHQNNNQDNDDKLERLKNDIQQLFASTTITHPSSLSTPTLPDVIGQQDELLSTPLPLAVEQLELEVRQEILQHTLEQPPSPLLLPDLTTLSNGNHNENKETMLSSISIEEDELSTPVIEETQTSNNILFQNEPDLLQHETPTVLHSVDSIVNAPTGLDLEVRDCFI